MPELPIAGSFRQVLFVKVDGSQLIEAIQASGYESVWIVTGGGVGAVHAMLAHPGASRFVKDVRIPYSAEALEEFLGERPASACSEATARKMAEAALSHATRNADHALGIACTAALHTSRERKGADRAHICILSLEKEQYEMVEVEPGNRAGQDAYVSGRLLSAIATFVGMAE